MTMTRAHFKLIADAIADRDIDDCIRPFLARHFARRLELANPRFDRARFLRACGVE